MTQKKTTKMIFCLFKVQKDRLRSYNVLLMTYSLLTRVNCPKLAKSKSLNPHNLGKMITCRKIVLNFELSTTILFK